MILSFDSAARKGDCFLLHFGTQWMTLDLILADGGPSPV